MSKKKKKYRGKIDCKKKREVLREVAAASMSVRQIAELYGISTKTIYKWQGEQRQAEQQNIAARANEANGANSAMMSVSDADANNRSDFIEISIINADEAAVLAGTKINSDSVSVPDDSGAGAAGQLTKATLVFADLALSLEGAISSNKLISILKILEEPC